MPSGRSFFPLPHSAAASSHRLSLRSLARRLHSSSHRSAQPESQKNLTQGATDVSHSHFISTSSPSSDFNPKQTPTVGIDEQTPSNRIGKLEPTRSHLFKLLLPLPSTTSSSSTPTAFLLHPSQPLSHLSRLITGSLPSKYHSADIRYLALTGRETDLDTHLRNAEEGQEEDGEGGDEGGPFLSERDDGSGDGTEGEGRFQEVSWSQSTDLSDFIKQSCVNEKFKIVITPEPQPIAKDIIEDSESESPAGRKNEGGGDGEMVLEVTIPTFESRTTYLRKRLLSLTKDLDRMTKQKKS